MDRHAREQLVHNMSMCKAGISLRELSEKGWKIPDRFVDRRCVGLLAPTSTGICNCMTCGHNHSWSY
jgi:hypothetical protein